MAAHYPLCNSKSSITSVAVHYAMHAAAASVTSITLSVATSCQRRLVSRRSLQLERLPRDTFSIAAEYLSTWHYTLSSVFFFFCRFIRIAVIDLLYRQEQQPKLYQPRWEDNVNYTNFIQQILAAKNRIIAEYNNIILWDKNAELMH